MALNTPPQPTPPPGAARSARRQVKEIDTTQVKATYTSANVDASALKKNADGSLDLSKRMEQRQQQAIQENNANALSTTVHNSSADSQIANNAVNKCGNCTGGCPGCSMSKQLHALNHGPNSVPEILSEVRTAYRAIGVDFDEVKREFDRLKSEQAIAGEVNKVKEPSPTQGEERAANGLVSIGAHRSGEKEQTTGITRIAEGLVEAALKAKEPSVGEAIAKTLAVDTKVEVRPWPSRDATTSLLRAGPELTAQTSTNRSITPEQPTARTVPPEPTVTPQAVPPTTTPSVRASQATTTAPERSQPLEKAPPSAVRFLKPERSPTPTQPTPGAPVSATTRQLSPNPERVMAAPQGPSNSTTVKQSSPTPSQSVQSASPAAAKQPTPTSARVAASPVRIPTPTTTVRVTPPKPPVTVARPPTRPPVSQPTRSTQVSLVRRVVPQATRIIARAATIRTTMTRAAGTQLTMRLRDVQAVVYRLNRQQMVALLRRVAPTQAATARTLPLDRLQRALATSLVRNAKAGGVITIERLPRKLVARLLKIAAKGAQKLRESGLTKKVATISRSRSPRVAPLRKLARVRLRETRRRKEVAPRREIRRRPLAKVRVAAERASTRRATKSRLSRRVQRTRRARAVNPEVTILRQRRRIQRLESVVDSLLTLLDNRRQKAKRTRTTSTEAPVEFAGTVAEVAPPQSSAPRQQERQEEESDTTFAPQEQAFYASRAQGPKSWLATELEIIDDEEDHPDALKKATVQ